MTPPFVRRAVTTAVAGFCAALALTAQPAAAGTGPSGGQTSDGYSVSVKVTYSGSAAPGGGGTQSVSVPAKCWWEAWDKPEIWITGLGYFDPTDADLLLKLLKGDGDSSLSPANERAAIAALEDGKLPTFYQYRCRDIVEDITDNLDYELVLALDEEDVPPPLIDPEDLAETAFDDMELETPEVDRNPKAAAAGQAAATLVNLPTWFWVTNPDSVGGDDGTEMIRAEVVDTPVFAELTATTNGLNISSNAGSSTCSPTRSQVEYRRGVTDDQACTVVFGRASQGAGWPVTATTAWSATWEGRTQDGESVGGNLGGTSRQQNFDVPVAEVQTLVRPE